MRARIAGAIVLAVGILLGTTGCGFLIPQTTLKPYDASDGVNGNVGSIAIRNAILISENGKAANLVVTLVNNDAKSHRLAIQNSDSAKTTYHVTVPANATEKIGSGDATIVILKNIGTKPGAVHPIFFQYGDKTGDSLLLPVLNGTLSSYKNLTPAAVKEAHPNKVVTAG